MPTIDPQPRRASSSRSQKSSTRPHSRASSNSSSRGPAHHHGLGGFTAIAAAAQPTLAKSDRPKPPRRRSGGTMSAKALSPEREPAHAATRQNSDGAKQFQGQTALKSPKVIIETVAGGAPDEEEGDWESSESGAVTPNPEAGTAPAEAATGDTSREVTAALRTLQLQDELHQHQLRLQQEQLEQQRRRQQRRQPLPVHEDERTPSPPQRRAVLSEIPQSSDKTPTPRKPAALHGGSINRGSHHHHGHHHPPLQHHPLMRAPSYTAPPVSAPPYLVAQSAQALINNPPSSSPLTNSPPSSPLLSARPGHGRKGSFSSTHSAATLPVLSTLGAKLAPSIQSESRRERTSSSISALSAATALSSLAAIPGAHQDRYYPYSTSSSPRPPTPPLTSRFPMSGPDQNIHPLLPHPYLSTHLTVTRYYDPLQDSFTRVADAKVRSRMQ